MPKLINGENYFNEVSFNKACKELEQGNTIEMYIDVIGHTRNNMVQEEYEEALVNKYGDRLIVEKELGSYSYSYSYRLKNLQEDKMVKNEHMTIVEIAKRAESHGALMFDRLSLIMDLEVAHEQFNLDLESLLSADDTNFLHDVIGIQNNIDRKKKEVVNCFVPRYSKMG